MSRPQRILIVVGTRPEAIKLAPVVRELRRDAAAFTVRVCATGQHRALLDQALQPFGIKPDIDLALMQPGQDLATLTARLIERMAGVVKDEHPDWILVQGDTTTVWTAALAGFYAGVRVGHVEAGLRTFDKRQPFPEEINRRLCSHLADVHFAPTARARANLLAEGIPNEAVSVTGNTVIDALHWMLEVNEREPGDDVRRVHAWVEETIGARRLVLITGHRRESFGEGFEDICLSLRDLAELHPDVHWVYPVHLNPNVQEPVRRLLGDVPTVHLLDPLAYAPFCWLLSRAELILTDSGGIQEEAPSLGKPVFVMRNVTERPEGVEAGCVRLVGTERARIRSAVADHLAGRVEWPDVARANPYGDGHASRRIADALRPARRA